MIKKKILMVDDSETNLLLFESMFEDDERIEVLLKNNGKNIVEYCTDNKPDLILLDLMMPEISGFQVLESLQSEETLKHIPIVIISALQGQIDIKRAIEMGAYDYIIKPVDFEENTKFILTLLGID